MEINNIPTQREFLGFAGMTKNSAYKFFLRNGWRSIKVTNKRGTSKEARGVMILRFFRVSAPGFLCGGIHGRKPQLWTNPHRGQKNKHLQQKYKENRLFFGAPQIRMFLVISPRPPDSTNNPTTQQPTTNTQPATTS